MTKNLSLLDRPILGCTVSYTYLLTVYIFSQWRHYRRGWPWCQQSFGRRTASASTYTAGKMATACIRKSAPSALTQK